MRNILKQTSWLFFAQAITRGIGFFYTIFLARALGVEDFGLYTVALAYFSIISGVADFGFNRFLIREVARDKSKLAELLWNIVLLRLTSTAVFFAIFSLVLYSLDPDKMRVSLILLSTLAILPQSIALTFDAIFVGLQKLQFSAIALLLTSLSTALLGLLLVNSGFGSMGAVNALLAGQLIYALLLIGLLTYQRGLQFSDIKLSILKNAFIGSLPYGLLGVLGLLYFRIDTVLLSYIKGSYQTGIYGVAYKFLEAITVVPSAFSMALFPVLSQLHQTNLAQARRLYYKALKITTGLGMLIFLGYIVVLPRVISIFLPQFLSSIEAVSIVAISIPFMFAQVAAVSVLLSTDKYLKQVIYLSVLTLIFNVLLNLIFIPQYGLIAAAWITVLSEILSFIIFFLFTRKILE